MGDGTRKTDQSGAAAWPFVMSWVGRTSALIGLFVTLAGGVTWLINHHRRDAERSSKMALAEAQANQGEYQAAVASYADLLKTDPLFGPALEKQLDTAMEWVEDFHALGREGQDIGNVAGPQIDTIMSILDAGLTRSKGGRAADIQAHIGWAHWLNQHIAEREFGDAAARNLSAALAADPSNVYANAMSANLELQNHGNFDEAVKQLNVAVSSGKARSFVRRLQIGGLISSEEPGAPAELVKVANDMRKSGEALDNGEKARISNFCFADGEMMRDHEALRRVLTAAPPDEVWSTYLWLSSDTRKSGEDSVTHRFIQANLMEVNGKRQEALAQFRTLQKDLKNSPGSLKDAVDAGVSRLGAGGS